MPLADEVERLTRDMAAKDGRMRELSADRDARLSDLTADRDTRLEAAAAELAAKEREWLAKVQRLEEELWQAGREHERLVVEIERVRATAADAARRAQEDHASTVRDLERDLAAAASNVYATAQAWARERVGGRV